MNDTPNKEWFVIEYPHSGSFAVANKKEALVTICGGATIGEELDIATRIAKLPALERELAAVTEERDALWADGVHTCSSNCKRGGCVLRRKLTEVTEQRDTLVTALRKIRSHGATMAGPQEVMQIQMDVLKSVSAIADEALAAVKGGSNE